MNNVIPAREVINRLPLVTCDVSLFVNGVGFWLGWTATRSVSENIQDGTLKHVLTSLLRFFPGGFQDSCIALFSRLMSSDIREISEKSVFS
jgi:hypothetical protein